jgi:DnaJ-class molecular chaperone
MQITMSGGGFDSMDAEEQDRELSDAALCYQAMGLSLDANPLEIERMYKSLTDEYKKKVASTDPALRAKARKDLELLREMNEKIQKSITYRAAHKEFVRKQAVTPAVGGKRHSPGNGKRPLHQSVIQNKQMVHCPRCNGLISREARICTICKAPIYTAAEKLRNLVTPARVAIFCFFLLTVAAVAVDVLYPEKVADLRDWISSIQQKMK